jgi:hypothetical protein
MRFRDSSGVMTLKQLREALEALFSVASSHLTRHTVALQLREKAFSVGSFPSLYHEDQRDKN